MIIKFILAIFFVSIFYVNAKEFEDCPLNKVNVGIEIFYDEPITFELSKNINEDKDSLNSVLKHIDKYEIHFSSINDFVKEYYVTPDIISDHIFELLNGKDYSLKKFDVYLLRIWEAYILKDSNKALQLIMDIKTANDLYKDNVWYKIILSLSISSFETKNIIKPDPKGNIYYKYLEKAVKYAGNDPILYFVIAECFKYIGYSNPSAHKIAYIEYIKSESFSKNNIKLKKYILKSLTEFYQLYQFYNSKIPEWLKEAIYRKMIELDPHNDKAYNNLGFLYINTEETTKEKYELALKYCKKAVELKPENINYKDSLAWAYYVSGNTKKAIEMYNKILKNNEDHYDSLSHLSSIYLNTENNRKSLKILKRILKIRPDDASALNNVGFILAELNENLKYALECCKKAVSKDPENDIYIDSLAWVYYKLKNYKEALKYQKITVNKKPKMIIYKRHLAEIMLQLDLFDEAEQQLLKILYIKPNDEQALLRLSALRSIMFYKFSLNKETFETKYSKDPFIIKMLNIFRNSNKNEE